MATPIAMKRPAPNPRTVGKEFTWAVSGESVGCSVGDICGIGDGVGVVFGVRLGVSDISGVGVGGGVGKSGASGR